MMTGRSSAKLKLKIRSRSDAHRENSFQSSSGAPSSRQMIGIGIGLADVGDELAATRRPATGSIKPFDDLAHVGPEPVGRLGVNAGATSRRSRACSSPSADRIDGRWRARNSTSVMPANSARRLANLWKRRSRRSATESS